MELDRRARRLAQANAEANMLAGGDFILTIRRPKGTIIVDLKRTGVIPIGHLIFQAPFGLISRFLWLFGARTWTVTVEAKGPKVLSRPWGLFEEVVATKAEGQRLAKEQVILARSGQFDVHLD